MNVAKTPKDMWAIDPRKTVLIVVDMQRAFVDEGAPAECVGAREVVPKINELADTCRQLKIPVMVHTGSGIPWSEPSLLHPIAEEYVTVKIIVAHAGMMVFASEAAYLAKKHANVFLECSWTAGFLIIEWIRDIGQDRIMFGSDHADNAAAELTKYRSIGLTNEEIDWALGKTAKSVFKVETHFK